MATHTVVAGETVSKIGRDHGFTVAQMQAANPSININKIFPGQILNLPGELSNGTTPGRQTVSYHVVVNEMGQLVRGSQGVGASSGGAGIYNVTFPEDVSGFAWQATIGAPDGQPQPAGSVTTQQGMGGAVKVVQVRTFAFMAGDFQAANRNFHLSIHRP